jgi:hypothetical protein
VNQPEPRPVASQSAPSQILSEGMEQDVDPWLAVLATVTGDRRLSPSGLGFEERVGTMYLLNLCGPRRLE